MKLIAFFVAGRPDTVTTGEGETTCPILVNRDTVFLRSGEDEPAVCSLQEDGLSRRETYLPRQG